MKPMISLTKYGIYLNKEGVTIGFGKTIKNKTDKEIELTFYIREGDNPGDSAGTKDVRLPPFETRIINDYNKQERDHWLYSWGRDTSP